MSSNLINIFGGPVETRAAFKGVRASELNTQFDTMLSNATNPKDKALIRKARNGLFRGWNRGDTVSRIAAWTDKETLEHFSSTRSTAQGLGRAGLTVLETALFDIATGVQKR